MIIAKAYGKRRRAATAVETALVMIPLLMFLFGIYEYGRLLMDWNLLNNSAREGCRYALANNTNSAVTANVQSIVTNFMAGRDASFSGFTTTVSGTHLGVATPVNNLMPGDMITVTVLGNYQFMNIIPMISMSNAFPLTCSVTMICEGGV